MVTTSVTSSSLSSNDISSLAQIFAVPLQYYSEHNSPLEEDYLKRLSTIVGLGFTSVLVDGSLISIYEPHLTAFITHVEKATEADHFSVLASAVAQMVSGAVFLARFQRADYYPLFVEAVERAVTHVMVQEAGKLEEAKRLLQVMFKE